MNLLRAHVDAYPTGKADVRFTFPVYSEDEEELRLNFNWEPALMSQISEDYGQSDDDVSKFNQVPIAPGPGNLGRPPVELLMYAIPHHQERMQPTLESSNKVHHVGCMPTIHGMACPVSTFSIMRT